MFNLKKQYEELLSQKAEIRAITFELANSKKYYKNHPEDHNPPSADESLVPIYIADVEALIRELDSRYLSIDSELNKRKYKIFNRK